MQLPAQRNLTLRRNSDYRETLQFTAGGEPVDLTGWTFKMQFRNGPQATDTMVLTVNTVTDPVADGFILTDAVNGIVDVLVSTTTLNGLVSNPISTADDYQNIIYDYYYYDIQATDGTEHLVYVYGVVSLFGGATH
jgi:hypothetical protein